GHAVPRALAARHYQRGHANGCLMDVPQSTGMNEARASGKRTGWNTQEGSNLATVGVYAHRAGRKHSRLTRHPASSCVRLTRALWLTARSAISNVSPWTWREDRSQSETL